jgi:hypothetical protein
LHLRKPIVHCAYLCQILRRRDHWEPVGARAQTVATSSTIRLWAE